MNEKSWLVIRIVAGLYVIYLGFQLVRGVLKDHPENTGLLIAAGIVFLIAGAAIVLYSAREVYRYNKRRQIEEAAALDVSDQDGEEESENASQPEGVSHEAEPDKEPEGVSHEAEPDKESEAVSYADKKSEADK